jgi:hypothetical protein
MPENLQGATFHVEHVIPRSKGGESTLENLALACPGCNLHKADKTTAPDPLTGERVVLFHPLQQKWSEQFRFTGHEMEGSTAIGRVTVAMLDLNHLRRQRIRQAEESFGLYPSTSLRFFPSACTPPVRYLWHTQDVILKAGRVSFFVHETARFRGAAQETHFGPAHN